MRSIKREKWEGDKASSKWKRKNDEERVKQ